MEGEKHNPIAIAALFVVLLSVGFVFIGQKGISDEGLLEESLASVSLEQTPTQGSILPPPPEFPSSIPIEGGSAIVVSMTTHHPGIGTLLSVSYESSEGQAEKILEYKEWLSESGFEIREKQKGDILKLYGTKTEGDIFISAHPREEGSLVEVSYLLK